MVRRNPYTKSPLTPEDEWLKASDLIGLPGIPGTVQNINAKAKKENWQARKYQGRGGGRQYHISALPAATQAALLKQFALQTKPSQQTIQKNYCPESHWSRYERAPKTMQTQANKRVEALHLYCSLADNGIAKSQAAQITAQECGINRASLYRWLDRVKNVARDDWPAALISGYTGRTKEAEFTPAAWEFFKADYLRLEGDSAAACYQRLKRAAAEHGWQIPAIRTVERWVEKKIPATLRVLRREGELALMRRFPAIQRTVKDLHATQWLNGDGYQHNVFVRWPDGTVERPKVWYWQDVYSRKMLSYRVDKTENTDTIRLSFGDLVEQFGIPEHITIDNTRAAANKWMTGGRDQQPADRAPLPEQVPAYCGLSTLERQLAPRCRWQGHSTQLCDCLGR